MGSGQEPVAYIDTHVAIWLFDALQDRVSPAAKQALELHDLMISPMAKLEIQYMHEIGRFRFSANEVCRELASSIGLQVSQVAFADVAEAALAISWTRDPFDRLIVAEAMSRNYPLITGDRHIRQNYPLAVW
jgi:PIN domain nuclease of toxin-antitoxin system